MSTLVVIALTIVQQLCVSRLNASAQLESARLPWLNRSRGGWDAEQKLLGCEKGANCSFSWPIHFVFYCMGFFFVCFWIIIHQHSTLNRDEERRCIDSFPILCQIYFKKKQTFVMFHLMHLRSILFLSLSRHVEGTAKHLLKSSCQHRGCSIYCVVLWRSLICGLLLYYYSQGRWKMKADKILNPYCSSFEFPKVLLCALSLCIVPLTGCDLRALPTDQH